MTKCKKCGELRLESLKACYSCVFKAKGVKRQPPMPLTPQEKAIAEAFLGKINDVLKKNDVLK